jgi:hypothetical protein
MSNPATLLISLAINSSGTGITSCAEITYEAITAPVRRMAVLWGR